MTLRHLTIFLSVCQNNYNTTKAAESLNMTQPAVSLAIKELESHYGVILFDRIGRRLKITATGQQFSEYATRIIALFDDMEKGMLNWDSFGILRVGASITIGTQFLPHYVKAFQASYPGTQIRATVSPSYQLEEKLLDNTLDFALMEGIVHSQGLISEAYMEDHLLAICPAEYRFKSGETMSFEDFKKQNFLLREHGSGTRELFDRVTETAGLSITPIWEAMSTTALVNAVINGLGVAVLPYRMVKGAAEQGLVTPLRVENLNFSRKFHIVYHKEKFLNPSAKAFLDLCRNYEMDYPLPNYHDLFS